MSILPNTLTRRLALVVLVALLVALVIGDTAAGQRHTRGTPLSAVAWGGNNVGQLDAGYSGGAPSVPQAMLVRSFSTLVPGYYATQWLSGDGLVEGIGGNAFGELGNGLHTDSYRPTRTKISEVVQLASGGGHSIALLKGGRVATWGGNSFGTVGDGSARKETGKANPVTLPLTGVASVYAGSAMDAVILTNGTVMDWGENKQGALGDGTRVDKHIPTVVSGLVGVKAVAFGGLSSHVGHSLFLKTDGTVWAAGDGKNGQLGNGTLVNSLVPVPVRGLANVVEISAGTTHSLARTADGKVYGFGDDAYGELPGLPAANPRPVLIAEGVSQISAGQWASAIIKGGKAFTSGRDHYNVIGDGTQRQNKHAWTPVAGNYEFVSLTLGEFHVVGVIRGVGPPPRLTCTAGTGTITVNWTTGLLPKSWTVLWRKYTHPPGKWEANVQHLPPATRSYTVTGLGSGVSYEVGVGANERGHEWGAPRVVCTPG